MLIIEDDEIKREQLISFIKESFPEIQIIAVKSTQSALMKITSNKYDLIILDMTLPTFDYGGDEDGGRIRAYGGRDILRQMNRHRITTPVIMVTQFDRFGKGDESLTLEELDFELQTEHQINYKGSVYYNAAYDDWKSNLHKLILKYANGE
jgi:CheY-like chemotaxis protein